MVRGLSLRMKSGVSMSKTSLNPPVVISSDHSKVVTLMRFFFVCRSLQLCYCIIIVCSSSVLLFMPGEGCVPHLFFFGASGRLCSSSLLFFMPREGCVPHLFFFSCLGKAVFLISSFHASGRLCSSSLLLFMPQESCVPVLFFF